jgi:hypothetical protein
MKGKTNLQIEYECSLNWMENYQIAGKESSDAAFKMRRHLEDLKTALVQSGQSVPE